MQKFILQFVYSFYVRWFLKIIAGVKFDNAKFLLQEEQFIIIANHNSHLDTMSLMASIPSRIIHKVKPVAALDHFGKTKFQERLSNYFINTLLIRRKRDKENPENDPIYNLIKALDKGYSLILFPEGTRGKPGKLERFKAGIALVLSQRPEVKYVPVYMKGMGKAMPKGDNLLVPHNSTLTYGAPKLVKSTKIDAILTQVEMDFQTLKNKSNH